MNAETTPRLGTLPVAFPATVAALHRVAEQVVAPARKPDNEIALTATPGGFGTPVFPYGGVDQQVRVHGAELVHRAGDEERRALLTTLEDARQLVGRARARWPARRHAARPRRRRGRPARRLVRLRRVAARGARPAPPPRTTRPRPTLWPEHFDVAIELGDEAAGTRANYGFSPGDERARRALPLRRPLDRAARSGELWNASGFPGAELDYAELQAAPTTSAPRARVLPHAEGGARMSVEWHRVLGGRRTCPRAA